MMMQTFESHCIFHAHIYRVIQTISGFNDVYLLNNHITVRVCTVLLEMQTMAHQCEVLPALKKYISAQRGYL